MDQRRGEHFTAVRIPDITLRSAASRQEFSISRNRQPKDLSRMNHRFSDLPPRSGIRYNGFALLIRFLPFRQKIIFTYFLRRVYAWLR